MFTLQDGREHLYQWDINRYVIVNDPTICEVHFCNRTTDCSLVVEVKDGKAAIPNILLQDARPIRVYAFCDDQYTKTEQQFTVKSRTKPEDYVYEETETLRYSTLDKKITELEENIPAIVAEEVEQYMEENPDVDLSNYYTKEETDELISNIDECDTYFFDPESYPWSNNTVKNPNYAPDDLAEFAQRFLNGEGVSLYIAFKDASEGIRWLTAEIITCTVGGIVFARNISWSDLNREAVLTSYLLTFNDTDNTWRLHKNPSTTINLRYATKDYVDNAIDAIPEPDLGDYAKKSDIPSIEGLATEEWVTQAIADSAQGETDLSNYYTKDEANSMFPRKGEVARDISILAEEVSDELLNYYTKEDIDNLFANIAMAEEGSY